MKGVDHVANRFLKISCTISEKRCSGFLRHIQSRRVRGFFDHSLFLPYHITDAEHFQWLLAVIPTKVSQTIEISLHLISWASCADIAPSQGTRVFSDSPAAEVWPLYPLFTELSALIQSFAEFDTTRDRCL